MTTTSTTTGFTIERSFAASVEELWEAWTDPDEVQHWWHPRGVRTPRESIELDVRAGGAYRYTMIDEATGAQYPTGGVYLEVSPPTRLVFTWGVPDADPEQAPVISVTLTPDGDQCRMTFTISRLDRLHDDIQDGWEQAIDILAEHLGRGR